MGTFVRSGKALKPIAPSPRYEAVDHRDLTVSFVTLSQTATAVSPQQIQSRVRVQVVPARTKKSVKVPVMLG